MRILRSHNPYNQSCEDDYAELQAENQELRTYRYKLLAHPNCNDPAHPGCKECREDAE